MICQQKPQPGTGEKAAYLVLFGLSLLYYGGMSFSKRINFFAARNALDLEREERLRGGLPLFDLSQSNPTAVGLQHPTDELNTVFADERNITYSPDSKGLALARSEIALHLGRTGRPVDPDGLLLCASTSEAYSYLFKLLCDPGDAIFVPKPGYPLFDHLAALESVKALGYRLEYNHPQGWSIDIPSMEKILDAPGGDRVKAIVLINPNNPTGSYVQASELDAILELCRRHSIALISDEVFFGFPLELRAKPVSLLGNQEVLTFVLDGLSKRLCLPQMKLGWICVSGPDDLVSKAVSALELISDTFLSAGTPIMNAAGSLLRNGEGIRLLTQGRMKNVMEIYREALVYEGTPHRILACEGGWTILVQSPRFASEEELVRGLIREKGIYVQPGYFFDMEKEAFFAFSLIVRPEDARRAALKYREYFERFI